MAQGDGPAPAGEHEHGEAPGADHYQEPHTHEFETFSHTVTVTGSWIPGTPEDAAQPVSVLTRDDLEAEGSPSVLDLIRNLPISLGANLGSEQFGVRAGADRSSLNLRGLGASRSLVLLNSDRLTWSPGAIPDQAQLMVDTNVLPMVAVERVEFLRDGGAATYGSDAIAGVMNVITRSHFDGLSFEGRHGVIDGSSGDSELGLIAGRPFAAGVQWRGETCELTPYSVGAVPPRGGALHDIGIYPCPGGPEITSCDSPDGLFVYLPPGFSTDADRDIGSVFGELSLPLASSLDSQLSLRFEDYGGDVGSSLDPKVALRWQATGALALRGSLGTTFRGPTLHQTVSGIAEAPREDIGPIGTAKPVRIHGDPALDPESATTFNAGLVVERSGLAGAGSRLFVTLDYWRYDFSDPLVIQPFATLIGLACPPAEHPLCDPGSPWFDALTISGGVPTIENLDSVSVRIVNGPDIETDGVDFRADFEADAGRGRLRLGAAATYALSWRIDGWELGEAYDAKGRLKCPRLLGSAR